MILTPTILTTDRLILRPLAPQDGTAITDFYTTERAAFTGGNVPRFQAWKNTAAMFGHWSLRGYGLWAITRKGDDMIIGMTGPFFPDTWPETEVGWLLFDGYEGHGYALEAARVAIHDARTRLGWTSIVHYIAPDNRRSIALAERLGAVLDADARQPKPDSPALVYRQPEVEP